MSIFWWGREGKGGSWVSERIRRRMVGILFDGGWLDGCLGEMMMVGVFWLSFECWWC